MFFPVVSGVPFLPRFPIYNKQLDFKLLLQIVGPFLRLGKTFLKIYCSPFKRFAQKRSKQVHKKLLLNASLRLGFFFKKKQNMH
jgi:hypothetical protein